jgi:hypothetical protein
MRCIACNALLSDYEATRKSQTTGEYLDLCNHCLNDINNDLLYTEREDLASKENPSDEDHHDFLEWKEL